MLNIMAESIKPIHHGRINKAARSNQSDLLLCLRPLSWPCGSAPEPKEYQHGATREALEHVSEKMEDALKILQFV